MRKSEIRNWLRNFFVKPKGKFEQKVWLWDKAIYGAGMSLMAFASRESFPLLVITGALILIAIYGFMARGK